LRNNDIFFNETNIIQIKKYKDKRNKRR